MCLESHCPGAVETARQQVASISCSLQLSLRMRHMIIWKKCEEAQQTSQMTLSRDACVETSRVFLCQLLDANISTICATRSLRNAVLIRPWRSSSARP